MVIRYAALTRNSDRVTERCLAAFSFVGALIDELFAMRRHIMIFPGTIIATGIIYWKTVPFKVLNCKTNRSNEVERYKHVGSMPTTIYMFMQNSRSNIQRTVTSAGRGLQNVLAFNGNMT